MNEFEYIGIYVLRLVMIVWMKNMQVEGWSIGAKMLKGKVMFIVVGNVGS
jgi:hypothetical protein